MGFLVIYEYKKSLKIVVKCKTSRWPPVWDIAVHLAVACDVYNGVFLCCPFFPRAVLDEILNLIESVSESFPAYSLYHEMGRERERECVCVCECVCALDKALVAVLCKWYSIFIFPAQSPDPITSLFFNDVRSNSRSNLAVPTSKIEYFESALSPNDIK